MRHADAYELARDMHTPGPDEWTVVPDKLMFQSCWECGAAQMIMLEPGPTIVRLKFEYEPELTAATRESDTHPLPLYREVLALRHQNAQLTQQVTELTEQRDQARKLFSDSMGDDPKRVPDWG